MLKKLKGTLLLIFVSLIVVVSCTKEIDFILDEKSDILNPSVQKDTNGVSTSDAKLLAENIFKSGSGKYSNKGVKKKVNEVTTFSTDSVSSSFHIINYDGGGFLILAGDKRSYPVLAFSNENNFDTDAEAYPDLLVEWLKNQGEYIKEIANDSINRSEFHKLWNIEEIEGFITSISTKQNKGLTSKMSYLDEYPLNVPVLITSYGPLLSTTWNQGTGYNNFAPDLNCSNYSNGRAPTGCVATAMSQIMRYHQYPSSYNWSIMPNAIYYSTTNSSGANEVARLMRDSGNSVGVDWGCDGSSATTSDVANALINTFNYSSATYSSSPIGVTINSEIAGNNPVILRGGEKTTKWLIFNVYDNGHAWVCDGTQKYFTKVQVSIGGGPTFPGGPANTFLLTSYLYHMNWGWGGHEDGWYANWENNEGSFYYKGGMIYNIRK